MRKKNLIIIIGLIAFIAITIGVSYSYFVYNKDVADISLDTGDISINLSNVNGNLNLANVIPLSDYQGINSTGYIDFTVNATVDTDKIYYEVYMLPNANNTLDTSYLKTYLTDQTNKKYSEVTLYNSLSNSLKIGGKVLYKGLVDINSNGTINNYSKNFRLRLWLDDNYPIVTSKTFNFDLYVYAYNVSRDVNAPICKRATTLHTEKCTNSDSSNYCQADGYALNDDITYGKLGTAGVKPTAGDAFDCDVNGDGQYNPESERFYYVSDYYDTNSQTFDTTRGVLIYYRNFVGGSPSDGGVAYYASVNENWHGPTTAVAALPANEANGGTWRNDLLKTNDRKILSCNNQSCGEVSDKTDNGNQTIDTGNTPVYNGKAGRLLHLKELAAGCGSIGGTGALKNCNFIMERTKYANASYGTYGPWFENPPASDLGRAWFVSAYRRDVVSDKYTYDTGRGARPAIDVLYSDILF